MIENKRSKSITKSNTSYPEKLPDNIINRFKSVIREKIKNIKRDEIKTRGEPLKYRKAFCYKVLDLFAEGKSKVTVATELGISLQQFCKWRKYYDEFDLAVRIGEQLGLRYWEEIGRINLGSGKINHILWMMNMTNKYKWFTSRNKEEKKFKKVNKKILEVKLNDNRIAKIINLAKHNETIIDSEKLIEDQSEIYTD
jgi:hypothetical protein